MYQTHKKNPIRLVSYDGEIVREFAGHDQLISCWPTISRLDIGFGFKREYTVDEKLNNKRAWRWRGIQGPVDHYLFALRDSFGDFIDPNEIRKEHYATQKRKNWRYRIRRNAYGHLRYVRTTQERKWANAWDDEEFAPRVRAKRNTRNIPDSWDDFWTHNDKCWKTQSKRRHQWKDK